MFEDYLGYTHVYPIFRHIRHACMRSVRQLDKRERERERETELDSPRSSCFLFLDNRYVIYV